MADAVGLSADLVKRIQRVAQEHRRERLLLEMVCIEWELSHLDGESRRAVEVQLTATFAVPAFGRMLEDSVRGCASGDDWTRLFTVLGL
jgi:hypothetical protein